MSDGGRVPDVPPLVAADVRLLVPAVVAWAVTASTLGWSPGLRLGVAAAALVVALAAVGLPRRLAPLRRLLPSWVALSAAASSLALLASGRTPCTARPARWTTSRNGGRWWRSGAS